MSKENERVLRSASERAARPNRIPINGQRDLIVVKGEKDPNFVERIVLDRPGRIDKFQNAGYEIVTGDVQVGDASVGKPAPEGSPVKVNMGRGEVGYLMRQKREFYEEDQQAKENELRSREELMIDKARSDGNYGTFDINAGSRRR